MTLSQRQHLASTPAQQETNLEFRRVELEKRTKSLALQAFHCMSGTWQPITLLAGKNCLLLGRDPYQCEIAVTGEAVSDIQAVLRMVGRNWYIVERGRLPMMEVNGFPYPQTMLAAGSSCLLRFGTSSVLLRLGLTSPLGEQEVGASLAPGLPEEGEYSLAMTGGMWRLPFNRTALIGSDPGCDFRIPGEIPFAALLTPHAGRLHLLSLMPPGKTTASADGTPAINPVPLRPGSVLSVGGTEFKLRLAKELRFVGEIDARELSPTGRLRLLQLDGNGDPQYGHALPPAGGTVTIGRSADHAHLSLPDSQGLSRCHAQLITYENTVMAMDQNSLNGTYVNGERINRRTLRPGDLLSLANVNFLLCYDEG